VLGYTRKRHPKNFSTTLNPRCAEFPLRLKKALPAICTGFAARITALSASTPGRCPTLHRDNRHILSLNPRSTIRQKSTMPHPANTYYAIISCGGGVLSVLRHWLRYAPVGFK
jgi:hypothetical protein